MNYPESPRSPDSPSPPGDARFAAAAGKEDLKILIVKMSAIGDVTYTLPALTALRRHFPRAHIAWLVEETAAEAVRGHRALDRLLIWRRAAIMKRLRDGDRLAVVHEIHRFARELRDTRYDLLIDFHALLKSGVWVLLARADRKVGFGPGMEHSEGSHLFLNERITAVPMDVHALDRGLILLNALGIPTGEVVYDFPIPEENEAEARNLLEAEGVRANDSLVAIHPMTLWRTKLWESRRFGEVADRLIEKGFRVAFTGSGGDRTVMDEICGAMTHAAIRLDGRTGLKTLAAVYRRARVVLSTDTGPMHIAAAVGTPVVALFGPTAPWRTGPHGKEHVALRAGLDCGPCFRKRCLTTRYEKSACMGRITVDRVVDAVVRGSGINPGLRSPSRAP